MMEKKRLGRLKLLWCLCGMSSGLMKKVQADNVG
jgi:hypothetical protein